MTMLLFRSEAHVDRWCRLWGQQRGEVFSLEQQWRLAKAWYTDRMRPDWRRKTTEEAVAVLEEVGLTSRFWDLDDPDHST